MQEPPQKVSVTDVNMPFGSMVVFILKWTLASIRALFLLFLIGLGLSTVALGLLRGGSGPSVGSVLSPVTQVDNTVAPTEDPPSPSRIGAPITGRLHLVRMLRDENGGTDSRPLISRSSRATASSS